MPYKRLIILSTFFFIFAQGYLRYSSRRMVERVGGKFVYREYDPRGEQVELLKKRSEKEYYKVKGGFLDSVSAPGLASMEFSVTWLRILAGVYEDASIEGDFSWLFHKLRFISHMLPPTEDSFQTAMMPLFVVLGKDPAGALFLLNEKLTKFKTDWRVAYWAGFHALENLHEKKLAGSYFLDAVKYPNAPSFLIPLGVRLTQESDFTDNQNSYFRKFAIDNLNPEQLEKVKKIRPEWFEVEKAQ